MLAQLPRDRSLGGARGVGGGRCLTPGVRGVGSSQQRKPPSPHLEEGCCCPSRDPPCALVTGPWSLGTWREKQGGRGSGGHMAGAAR